jgi:hypothetical protein
LHQPSGTAAAAAPCLRHFEIETRERRALFGVLNTIGNPNVAPPGSEGARDLEWIDHFRGDRLYGELRNGRWRFKEFRCPPGEIYFDAAETAAIARWSMPRPVVIEPTVKAVGACVGANKQWPLDRYLQIAAALAADGEFPVALGPSGQGWDALPRIVTATFRGALCVLSLARLYIGPEGGLHHAAARNELSPNLGDGKGQAAAA